MVIYHENKCKTDYIYAGEKFKEIVIEENNVVDNHGKMLIYQTEDGLTKIDVNMQNETVWLTQEQMGELFQKAKSTINEHIKNIYSEGELQQEVTMRKFGNTEFSTKPTNYYNCSFQLFGNSEQLKVKTNFGEDLSWEYLQYAIGI